MKSSNEFFRVPALPVQQPFGKFYVSVLPADILRKVAFSDVARVTSADSSGYRLTGTQRRQHQDRWAEIAKFIDTLEAVFPTSIVLAANYRNDGGLEEGERRWRIDGEDPHYLVIPSDDKLASVVDGQHRLWAFDYATNNERSSMPLVCSIFLDLPNPYQAYLFATVNFNQKKVDRSLAYELWGFDTEDEAPQAWTPEKTAVFLARRLNMDEMSPFRRRIKVAMQDDKELVGRAKGEWAVSSATVVDGLLRLFSRRPKSDRTTMFTAPRQQRRRDKLPEDGSPARGLFRDTNDKTIYELARSFFSAADRVLWQPASHGSYIIRTVGVQALFDVLERISIAALAAKTLRESFFEERLRKADHIDFSQGFFQASGIGRARIKHCLFLAIGLETLSDLPANDRDEYRQIVPWANGTSKG
jgi:DNA phosphorothioation-associated DGQHR protein 1